MTTTYKRHAEKGNGNNAALSAQQSADLCQACGICCTGAFFSHVIVSAKEAEALKGTAIKTYENKKDKIVFDQPCAALSGTSCSIYNKRPGSCRAFLCKLTRNVLTGETELDSALEIVAELKTVSAWLVDNTPMDMIKHQLNPSTIKPHSIDRTLTAWQKLKNEGGDIAAEEVRANSLGLLQVLMGLYFRFEQKQNAGELSEQDVDYLTNAFAFAKLCDRYFEKSRLLRKYAQLIQRI